MRTTARIALVPALLLLSSCIEFEKQTLTFRYDEAQDRLLIFQVYEGIYGRASGDALNEGEAHELASVMERQRTFFFSNWIFEYDRKSWEEGTTKPPGEEEAKTPEKLELYEELQTLASLVVDNVEVKNGRFYLNADQKLCAYQYVTIAQASKIVQQANRAISMAVLAKLSEVKPGKDVSRETMDALKDAAAKGYEWLALRGGSIKGQCPVARPDAVRFRQEWAKGLREELAAEGAPKKGLVEGLTVIAALLEQDVWVSYRDDTFEVVAGHPTNARTAVTLEPWKGHYKPNAVEFAKQKYGIAEEVDTAKLVDEFFGARKLGGPGK